jgi:hypothetical protein
MVVGCHQQPTIATIFFDNGSHIIGNILTTIVSVSRIIIEDTEGWMHSQRFCFSS